MTSSSIATPGPDGGAWVALLPAQLWSAAGEAGRRGGSPLGLQMLSDGSCAPQTAQLESCMVVCDGRPSRRDRIVPSLSRDVGDAELVLRAYLSHGVDALRRLRGAFVAIVWDARQRKLAAVRAPMGYWPMYYATSDEGLLLSMSQDMLIGSAGGLRTVDRAAVAGWICGTWLNETFFTGVSRLLPGHLLSASAEGVTVERCWNPIVPERPEPLDGDAAWADFDALLTRSVEHCLDVGPAAIYLSGGVDSSVVAAVATQVSRRRGLPDPVALSLWYADPDESAAQRAVAAELGIPQVLMRLEDVYGAEGPVVESLLAASWLPMPPVTPWLHAPALDQAAIDRECRVVLGGDGSEWLNPGGIMAADLLRRLDLRGLSRMLASKRQYTDVSRREAARSILWQNGGRLLLREAALAGLRRVRGERRVAAMSLTRQVARIPEWIVSEPELRHELAERWAGTQAQRWTGSFYAQARRRLLAEPKMTTLVDYYYERSRRLGLEFAEPLDDPDLAEFLLSVPPALLIGSGEVKSFARRSIRHRHPRFDLGCLRGAYFDSALQSAIVSDGARIREVVGEMPALAGLGLVDQPTIASALSGAVTGLKPRYTQVWRAVAAEAWLQGRT